MLQINTQIHKLNLKHLFFPDDVILGNIVHEYNFLISGEWVVILVTALKQFTGHTTTNQNVTTKEIFDLFTSQNLKMENFGFIFIGAHTVSLSMYFLIGGFLHVSLVYFSYC